MQQTAATASMAQLRGLQNPIRTAIIKRPIMTNANSEKIFLMCLSKAYIPLYRGLLVRRTVAWIHRYSATTGLCRHAKIGFCQATSQLAQLFEEQI